MRDASWRSRAPPGGWLAKLTVRGESTVSCAGALLIGDAAHTCSPVGAQGINIALRDSIVAANHLVPALRDRSDLGEAMRRIEAERLPEVKAIQQFQSMPPRVIFSHSPWVQKLRGVTKLLRYDFIRRLGARQAGVFATGVTDVKLTV